MNKLHPYIAEKLVLAKSFTFTDYSLISFAFFLPISTVASNIFLALTLASCVYKKKYWSEVKNTLQLPSIRLLLVFILWLCVGSIFAFSEVEHGFALKSYKLALIPLFIPVFTKTNRPLVMGAFISAMLLTLALTFVQKIPGLEFTLHQDFSPGAIFKNHIATSFFMALACFFVAHQWHNKENHLWSNKPIIGLLIFYLLFLNAGRTGYIIFFALFALYFYQVFKLKGAIIGSIAAVIIAGLSYQFSPKLTERVTESYHEYQGYHQGEANTSAGERLEFLSNSWYLFKQKPFCGWGTKSFKAAYETLPAEWVHLKTSNPHNQFALIAVENGIIGLILFLSFILYCFYTTFTLAPFVRNLFQGLLCAYMVGCLGNSFLLDHSEGYLFSLFCALFLSHHLLSRKQIHSQRAL